MGSVFFYVRACPSSNRMVPAGALLRAFSSFSMVHRIKLSLSLRPLHGIRPYVTPKQQLNLEYDVLLMEGACMPFRVFVLFPVRACKTSDRHLSTETAPDAVRPEDVDRRIRSRVVLPLLVVFGSFGDSWASISLTLIPSLLTPTDETVFLLKYLPLVRLFTHFCWNSNQRL